MALTPISTSPNPTDFIPLAEHQAQTPTTFFGGKPVLHLFQSHTSLCIPKDQFLAQDPLKSLWGKSPDDDQNGDEMGGCEREDGSVLISGLDLWVTSRNLILYSTSTLAGIQVEYRSITVTAQDGRDVLLELNLSEPDIADDEIEMVQMRITPAKSSDDGTNTEAASSSAPAAALFNALSACQELHPDPPASLGDDYESTDATAPGASGWITSENMAEYTDENGNFQMPSTINVIGEDRLDEGEEGQSSDGMPGRERRSENLALGEGAGRIRTATELVESGGRKEVEEVEEEEEDQVRKWQRRE